VYIDTGMDGHSGFAAFSNHILIWPIHGPSTTESPAQNGIDRDEEFISTRLWRLTFDKLKSKAKSDTAPQLALLSYV